ncbi:DNA cytosine methyltransferase [Heliobacterium chlorum]|uniref:DNA (cytosine-5-)-methyltransferase n=1 Tax=Heliobacterium chlorum TaxID=2698 RepID=A0ABR7T4D0_HELCL|nr:DNA cytosine methyltransferase [Heliobacterium chlorum]MBC9785521.1 DNA cytosine methyltransferase [Heliobacterium chlorum]
MQQLNDFTFIDLFSGAGGMSVGFVDAGYTSIYAVENNYWASLTYKENFGDHVDNRDIEQITDFPHATVIIGGPPCQGFSPLGKRLENDPRNQLWRHYLRAVECSQPLVFVIENVPEILKSAEFTEIERVSKALGYVLTSGTLFAADFGVPQKRKRAFIIGSKVGKISFPEPLYVDPAKYNKDMFNYKTWVTVQEAFRGLPEEPNDVNWHVGRNATPISLERYKCIPPGGNRFDLPDNLKPDCWKKKKTGSTDVFGRLSWNEPSLTIRTEFFKPEKGRYLHPSAHRPITHREAARLQTFPDEFIFVGSKIEVAKQIGNAVPCKLAYHIAKKIKQHLLVSDKK